MGHRARGGPRQGLADSGAEETKVARFHRTAYPREFQKCSIALDSTCLSPFSSALPELILRKILAALLQANHPHPSVAPHCPQDEAGLHTSSNKASCDLAPAGSFILPLIPLPPHISHSSQSEDVQCSPGATLTLASGLGPTQFPLLGFASLLPFACPDFSLRLLPPGNFPQPHKATLGTPPVGSPHFYHCITTPTTAGAPGSLSWMRG